VLGSIDEQSAIRNPQSEMRTLMTRTLAIAAILSALTCGCASHKEAPKSALHLEPTVVAVKPSVRTIVRTVAQPGVIEAYEQTAIYTRVAGYVLKWYVDIGDRVNKGDLLAEIMVPELVEELKQNQAQVEMAQSEVMQSQKQVQVAESNVQIAANEIEEARAAVNRYQADVERWESEVKRLTSLAQQNVVNPQVLDETRKQLRASEANRDVAGRAVTTKQSQRLAAEMMVDKAKADLIVAEARAKVAEARMRRISALVDYTKVTAPYDAVITVRNVNTGDAVRPAAGDPTAASEAESVAANRATPLYVLRRSDRVMFVVGVPEIDAALVSKGTPAQIRILALGNEEIPATVTRTTWSLNSRSRTLQAQIDILNPDRRLLPGMYAYGKIMITHKDVLAVPASAVFESGNKKCCYMLVDGKAVCTPIQVGISDGGWIEVRRKQVKNGSGNPVWEDFTGAEQVATGDLSELTDGAAVRIAETPTADRGQVSRR
jgi:RND family efflux transporter MFP subunit